MKRYVIIFRRLLQSIPKWLQLRKEFGNKIAFWMCLAYVLPSVKRKRYIKALSEYFQKDLSGLVKQYKNSKTHTTEYEADKKIPVWICWLSGYESMPEIVKVCYKSVIGALPEERADLKLITLDNVAQYIDIPRFIMEKYEKGIISAAHLSDIIRFSLLCQYGGMWLDATVFVSGKIPLGYLESEYYTQKIADINRFPYEPSRAQWCGFIWAGKKGNELFSFVKDGLLYYWKKYNTVVDYIFFDYIILTAYNNIPEVRKMMDQQKPNNEEIWGLWNMCGEIYYEEAVNQLFQKNIFHKLTYKSDVKKLVNQERTVYGFLIDTVM